MKIHEGPDRVNIRKSDRDIYKDLREKSTSPFKGKDNRVLYMMALAVGFIDGERLEFEPGEKEGFILLKTLEDEDIAIINAIAVAEEDNLSVLADKKKVYTIADEYAAGGIRLLNGEVFGGEYGSYIKKLEGRLVEEYQRIKEKYGVL
jgi:hypothetical protein